MSTRTTNKPNMAGERSPVMDDDIDNTSTPFASAPSSPGRSPAIGFGGGYFFSAPTSPIYHLLLSSSASAAPGTGRGCAGDAEFEFGRPSGPMISADELFQNGQICPLTLPPLQDLDPGSEEDYDDRAPAPARDRNLTPRCGSVQHRTRSMSPLRSASPRLKLLNALVLVPGLIPAPNASVGAQEAASSVTASSRSSLSSSTSSSSSSGRGSRPWMLIKDMLVHRSKSKPSNGARALDTPRRHLVPSPNEHGRSRSCRRPGKELPPSSAPRAHSRRPMRLLAAARTIGCGGKGGESRRASVDGGGGREALRGAEQGAGGGDAAVQFLLYRQGLLGCLGFSSRCYGALHGPTKNLNPVFSG